LSGCSNVSDVNALGHVLTLNLSWCPNVSDISALHIHVVLKVGLEVEVEVEEY
jgi:hypothetical protein